MRKELKKPDLEKIKNSDIAKKAKAARESGIIKEFRDFINRGSVMDLAVGVIIGGAFQKIISSLVSDILMPVIGIFIGGVDFTDLIVKIPSWNGEVTLNLGVFIQNVVDFVIIAFVIFLVVRFVNRLKAKAEKEEKAEEKAAEEDQLAVLKEIRDSLKKGKK